MTEDHSRRVFMGTTAKSLAATAALSAVSTTGRAAPSERVRIAVIGNGNQGSSHARVYDQIAEAEVVALCDLDPKRRAKLRGALSNTASIREEEDFERILEDPEIDGVSIATPDHWHTPIALHALKAGKHVYVEKPCAHNIHEAVMLGKAAKKYGKCVQHGTQSRSSKGIQDAVAFLREGKLGKIRAAKAINHQKRDVIGRAPVEDPPEGVNYDKWLGPAPVQPFTKNRWHYNWHWFWDYGGGDMVNDGIHQVDQARWGLGVGLPKAISGSGTQLFYDDDHETPDTQMITFEYDECYLIYEMRLWTDYPMEGHDNGVVFYGDKGIMEIGRKGCFAQFIGEKPQKIGGGADFGANLQNYVNAIKANDPSLLQSSIDEGIVSASLCHMGNIVTRVGRRLEFDAKRWQFKNDDDANGHIKRSYRKGYELPDIG
jgi:predicted dehydrogenase